MVVEISMSRKSHSLFSLLLWWVRKRGLYNMGWTKGAFFQLWWHRSTAFSCFSLQLLGGNYKFHNTCFISCVSQFRHLKWKNILGIQNIRIQISQRTGRIKIFQSTCLVKIYHVSLPTCDNSQNKYTKCNIATSFWNDQRTVMKQLRESFDNVNSGSVATGI